MQGHHGTQSQTKTARLSRNCEVESMAFELPSLPVIVAGGPGTWFANTLFVAPCPLCARVHFLEKEACIQDTLQEDAGYAG